MMSNKFIYSTNADCFGTFNQFIFLFIIKVEKHDIYKQQIFLLKVSLQHVKAYSQISFEAN